MGFRPRELLEQAERAEKNGELRQASNHYAALGSYLIQKERWKDAITALEKAVALSPAAPRLYVQLAIAQKGQGDKELSRSSAIFFTRRATQNRKFGSYGDYISRELAKHPELREAIYEEYLNFDRTQVGTFLELADALSAQERWVRALEVLLDALQLKEKQSEVLAGIERCLVGLGKNDQQIFVSRYAQGKLTASELRVLLTAHSATEAVESQEKDLHGLISDLERKLGIRLDEPYANIDKVVKEFRDKSEPILGTEGRGRLDMATAFKEMGLWREALDELLKVAAGDPLSLECHFLRAEILREQGSDLAALEAYQAILRSPQVNETMANESRYQMVQLYLKFSDYKSAMSTCLQLEKNAPDYRDLKTLKVNIQGHLRSLAE